MKGKIPSQQKNKPERSFQEAEFKFVAPSDTIFEKIESLEEIGEFKILDKKQLT